MTHLEIENLASDYLEGQLEPGPRVRVEAHLTECAACRELLEDVRRALELCRATADIEPAPWLTSKILLATVGERRPTFRERLAAFLRPSPQPRLAYMVAMTIFSLSVIINAAGLNVRSLTLEDLDPRTWVFRANRMGHVLYARAEKFYFDLRMVYEIESRFRQLRNETPEPEKEAPKPETPGGGSTDLLSPGPRQLASVQEDLPAQAGLTPRAATVATGGAPTP